MLGIVLFFENSGIQNDRILTKKTNKSRNKTACIVFLSESFSKTVPFLYGKSE